jgi:probable rRNA maturation factor
LHFEGELVSLSSEVRSRWAREALPALSRFACRAQRATKLRGEVDVLLVSPDQIRQMNRWFRAQNKITDVLSFPTTARRRAGDIAICAAKAQSQARTFGHGPEEEVKILMLHGMLHLAGFDHERDAGEMALKEERLRKQLGLPRGLIKRAGARGAR